MSGASGRIEEGFAAGLVLGIETSGGLTGTALAQDGRLIAESALDIWARSQEMLMAQVERVLGDHGRRPSDLARIGVAVGPGSFTGLRVGIAAAQGLALGLGIPCVAVSSHQALGLPYRGLDCDLVFLTGERRGTVMLEAGRWVGADWQAWLPAEAVAIDAVEARLRAGPASRTLLFIGEAVDSIRRAQARLADLGSAIDDPFHAVRRPGAVARLAASAGARLIPPTELERLAPVYLRGADARRPERRPAAEGPTRPSGPAGPEATGRETDAKRE